jgi:hypothetical protein
MRLPNIEIEWTYYKELDEIHIDDMRAFGIILLTLVKGDNIQLVAYEIDTNKWALLQE